VATPPTRPVTNTGARTRRNGGPAVTHRRTRTAVTPSATTAPAISSTRSNPIDNAGFSIASSRFLREPIKVRGL
jgi:hypothetical protein